jgi:uncharacterized membrane protein
MTMMLAGLALWTLAHLFKRLAPQMREGLGNSGKGIVAIVILAGVVLMVLGYRAADTNVFWGRSPALVGINNLLMLISVYLVIAGPLRAVPARKMRHPMLIGVKTWALAHFLVNGDVASFVLFGGILAWAVVQMILINRANREWTRPAPVGAPREMAALVVAVGLFVAIAYAHTLAGYPVFG